MIYNDHIVILINHDQLSSLSAQESENLAHFLKKNQLCAGVSNGEEKISDLARLYRQALMAIDIGNYLGLDDQLFNFKEHRLSSMIYAFVKLGDIESYLNPCIKQLQAYDQRKGAALLPTLVAYLDNNCKQLKASQDLYIQRGTLIYRLKKIEELCKIDLTDQQVIFDLQLSLKLHQFIHLN